MTGGSDFTAPDLVAKASPEELALATAYVRRHCPDLLDVLGLDGCSPMGVNARGVAQRSEGHGDYPDACASAQSRPGTGSRRDDYARRVAQHRNDTHDAQGGTE